MSEPVRPRERAGTLLAIAATYAQFLLWAQFGFLRLLRERLASAGEVQLAMAAMGLAGLAASLVTARALAASPLKRLPGSHRVAAGLAAAALAALAALPARGLLPMALAAAAIGAATAFNTVTLAAELGALLPRRNFGLTVGTGTGLAYLLCNLPPLFQGPPGTQAAFTASLCALATLVLVGRAGGRGRGRPREGEWLRPDGFSSGRSPSEPRAGDPGLDPRLARPERPRMGFRAGAPLAAAWLVPRGLAAATLALTVLVGLDSAAFARIQASPELQALTWGGGGLKPLLGVVHLAAAVAAGWLLDRGRFAGLLGGTWALFTGAFTLLGLTAGAARPAPLAGPLYAAGISLYSVALVVLPASARGGRGARAPRWRAALVFGIAGWLGSALGVGMAQDLGRIPREVLLGAGALIALALLAGTWRPATWARARAIVLAPAAGGLAFVLLALVAPPARPMAGTSSAAERGRRVYIAEGCIHCHSQYVRPGSADELPWGPSRPLDRGRTPVLIGTRRQGPDLTNAGNRRGELWHRLHLIDPSGLSPGSRMPSYAFLFSGEGRRGEDLVAYLASLGVETIEARRAAIAAAPVPVTTGSAERGRPLFARHCSACHGPAGRGDGRWAAVLATPVLDLGKPAFRHVSTAGPEPLPLALARLIRFGLPGTSMPGHETLPDGEVADLAAFAATLPGSAREPR